MVYEVPVLAGFMFRGYVAVMRKGDLSGGKRKSVEGWGRDGG